MSFLLILKDLNSNHFQFNTMDYGGVNNFKGSTIFDTFIYFSYQK